MTDLQQWWDALTPQERAEALKAQRSGRMSAAMKRSLAKAGRKGDGDAIPGDVEIFLKARH
jgi:hypothetical protein